MIVTPERASAGRCLEEGSMKNFAQMIGLLMMAAMLPACTLPIESIPGEGPRAIVRVREGTIFYDYETFLATEEPRAVRVRLPEPDPFDERDRVELERDAEVLESIAQEVELADARFVRVDPTVRWAVMFDLIGDAIALVDLRSSTTSEMPEAAVEGALKYHPYLVPARWSHDGRCLAVGVLTIGGGVMPTRVVVLDPETRGVVHVITPAEGRLVDDVAFSPDGRLLAVLTISARLKRGPIASLYASMGHGTPLVTFHLEIHDLSNGTRRIVDVANDVKEGTGRVMWLPEDVPAGGAGIGG